jgi:hypothetical protein
VNHMRPYIRMTYMVHMKNTSLKRLTGHEISKLLFQPSELKKIEIRYLYDIELSKKQNPQCFFGGT